MTDSDLRKLAESAKATWIEGAWYREATDIDPDKSGDADRAFIVAASPERILAIEAEAVASLTAQLEQERAKVASRIAALFDDARSWWANRHADQCGIRDSAGVFCAGREPKCPLPMPTYLSDLTLASKQYLEGVRAEAVAKERKRLHALTYDLDTLGGRTVRVLNADALLAPETPLPTGKAK